MTSPAYSPYISPVSGPKSDPESRKFVSGPSWSGEARRPRSRPPAKCPFHLREVESSLLGRRGPGTRAPEGNLQARPKFSPKPGPAATAHIYPQFQSLFLTPKVESSFLGRRRGASSGRGRNLRPKVESSYFRRRGRGNLEGPAYSPYIVPVSDPRPGRYFQVGNPRPEIQGVKSSPRNQGPVSGRPTKRRFQKAR